MFSTSKGFPFSDPLVQAIQNNLKFEQSTSVQAESFSAIATNNDVLIRSCTGSGKSLAFLLPILDHIIAGDSNRSSGIQALVLSPTRELALQLQSVCNSLLKSFPGIVCGCIVGGDKRKSEKARIRKGFHILISTPGRLRDHFDRTANLSSSLESLSFIVLDEADQLLDQGFYPQIKFILEQVNQLKVVQRILVSATLTSKVLALVNESLHDPIIVDCSSKSGNQEELIVDEYEIPETVEQLFTTVDLRSRFPSLVGILANEIEKCERGLNVVPKIIVFVFSCVHVDFIHTILSQLSSQLDTPFSYFKNSNFSALHGDLDMIERRKTMDKFRQNPNPSILIATDVAARGLDISNVTTVIQYDPPCSFENYVHRIGRSGRIGNSGRSVLVLNTHEKDFIQHLGQKGVVVDYLEIENVVKSLCAKFEEKVKGPRKRLSFLDCCRRLQSVADEEVAKNDGLTALARQSYQSFISAYNTFPKELRPFFNKKLLHLGHVCKSFCLKDSPSTVSSSLRKVVKENRKRTAGANSRGKRGRR
ncbi:hypothetical protein GEMRC1_013536 [Eukaryota sp. GEM-RC1]